MTMTTLLLWLTRILLYLCVAIVLAVLIGRALDGRNLPEDVDDDGARWP